MSEFARQVVREEAPLSLLAPAVAVKKRREKLVGAILGSQVFCHFETVGRRLRCAFSNERKYLLGETVRDWLADARGVRDFLWCEALDDELALVLVANGRVVKDPADVQDADREVATALGRLDARAPVFVHQSAAHYEALSRHPRCQAIETSVLDHVARLRNEGRPVAELGPVSDILAVRVWNACWKWTQFITLSAVGVAGVAFAYFQFTGQEPTVEVTPEAIERSLDEYDRLLQTPDARAVLAAMHLSYRRFVADPFFGAGWDVLAVTWRRPKDDVTFNASSNTQTWPKTSLRIVAQLPHALPDDRKSLPSSDDDVQFGIPREELVALQAAVRDYAGKRGWRVAEVDSLTATVDLPIVVSPRTEDEADRNRLPTPPEGNRWHFRTLRRDLEAFGVLRQVERAVPRNVPGQIERARATSYHTDEFSLDLAGLEWAYPDAARWLGERLSGGPVVLDEVELERATAPERAVRRGWKGKILFRTVWSDW